MDIVNEFDKKLAWIDPHAMPPDYEDGREQGLKEGRELAMAYVKHRQAADLELCEEITRLRRENNALRGTIDVAREILSREVLGQTMPHNFEDLASIVVKACAQYREMEREQDQHTCECDCEYECDCEFNEECYQDCEECD